MPDSFETAMRMNSIALSPLLVRQGGALRVIVEDWCRTIATNAAAIRETLGIRMACTVESKSLPLRLLRDEATGIMLLGLLDTADASTPGAARAKAEQNLDELIDGLARRLTDKQNEAYENVIQQYALLVYEEEPLIGTNRLKQLLQRRANHARSIVVELAERPALGADFAKLRDDPKMKLEATKLDADLDSFSASHQTLLDDLRGKVKSGGRSRKKSPVKPRTISAERLRQIQTLINNTIVLLRAELLKDVSEATREPVFATWGADRVVLVNQAAAQLKCSLANVRKLAGNEVSDTYRRCALATRRAAAFKKWLSA
jgi:hypothetical protein